MMPKVAQAVENNSDTPPPQTTGTSGGSRGCETQTQTSLSTIVLYAQTNLWYDTVGIVLAAKDEPSLRELKSSVLEQVAIGAETIEAGNKKVELTNSAIHQFQR